MPVGLILGFAVTLHDVEHTEDVLVLAFPVTTFLLEGFLHFAEFKLFLGDLLLERVDLGLVDGLALLCVRARQLILNLLDQLSLLSGLFQIGVEGLAVHALLLHFGIDAVLSPDEVAEPVNRKSEKMNEIRQILTILTKIL